MSACAVVPIRARTLYAIEGEVIALLDCLETVTPDQEEQFLADFGKALEAAKDKRDDVARYMAHCESQIELAKAEMARLRDRKEAFERAVERLKSYVVRVMESAGTKRLEGNSVTFSLRKCPVSVEVTDETVLPLEFKSAALTVPGPYVDAVLDALPFDADARLAWAVDKRAVKATLEGGAKVDGAKLIDDKQTLVRK